jgi:hypothetical protein
VDCPGVHARAGRGDEPQLARPTAKTEAKIDDKTGATPAIRIARPDRRTPIQQRPNAPVRPVMGPMFSQ